MIICLCRFKALQPVWMITLKFLHSLLCSTQYATLYGKSWCCRKFCCRFTQGCTFLCSQCELSMQNFSNRKIRCCCCCCILYEWKYFKHRVSNIVNIYLQSSNGTEAQKRNEKVFFIDKCCWWQWSWVFILFLHSFWMKIIWTWWSC